MKFFKSDSTIKRMSDTLGMPWITFRRTNKYTSLAKLSVVGVPWYDVDEWEKIKNICEDPESFHKTYMQWLSYADKATVSLTKQGKPFERVKIKADEYENWCTKNKVKKNRSTRIKYVQHQLQKKLNPY